MKIQLAALSGILCFLTQLPNAKACSYASMAGFQTMELMNVLSSEGYEEQLWAQSHLDESVAIEKVRYTNGKWSFDLSNKCVIKGTPIYTAGDGGTCDDFVDFDATTVCKK